MSKMNINPHNRIVQLIMGHVQHYNPNKYWRRRAIVVNPDNKTPKIIKLLYLYYIKKCDAFNNASLGTDINQGAVFETQPDLAHGLNGIIVHLKAHIGKNATIWQQVTIGSSGGGTPYIGDNCKIGAGAKILGGIRIGNNVTIGANTVVTKDVPDNCLVVGSQMRVIEHHSGDDEDINEKDIDAK